MKTQRAKIIKSLFNELCKDIVVRNEIQMFRLEYLKRMENHAIEENSDEAVERIKEFVEMEKNQIKKYSALGLKSQWVNGKFVITKL